ncbi:hypothetical protein EDM80_07260 [bacterium]|nr:MAG: hypothetical protein EDM80_07260 [bacterium]
MEVALMQPDIDASLYDANLKTARGILSRMDPYDRAGLLDKLGVKREYSENEREAFGAQTIAYIATAAGQDFDAGARAAAQRMTPALWADLARRYSGGAPLAELKAEHIPLAGSGRKKKKRKPGPFRAIQNEIGRGLIKGGREVKRWTKAPIVGKYLVGPMGAEVIGETLAQVGQVFRGGSIRDFDDRAFVLALGHTLSASGQALIAASPFLPAPWNAAALAAGTASLMIGKVATEHVKAQEARERARNSFAAPDGASEETSAQNEAGQPATNGAETRTF